MFFPYNTKYFEKVIDNSSYFIKMYRCQRRLQEINYQFIIIIMTPEHIFYKFQTTPAHFTVNVGV